MVRISLVLTDELDAKIKMRALEQTLKNKKIDKNSPTITKQDLLTEILEKEFKIKK